jgi:hypothetical protein
MEAVRFFVSQMRNRLRGSLLRRYNILFRGVQCKGVFFDPLLTKGFTQREGSTKLELRKWLGKAFAAVSGERAEVNQELGDNAKLIDEDSYGKDWMFKIRPDTKDERKNLMTDPGEIQEWPKKEIAEHGGK